MVSVSVFARKPVESPAETDYDAMPFMAASQPGPSMYPMTLNRTGMRPMKVTGAEIVSATSHQTGTPFWYELNVVSTDDGRMLIDIRNYQKREGSVDRFKVIEAYGIEDVVSTLENYDPVSDMVTTLDLENESMSAVELTLQAAMLKLSMLEARRQFRELVGEVLHGLEA